MIALSYPEEVCLETMLQDASRILQEVKQSPADAARPSLLRPDLTTLISTLVEANAEWPEQGPAQHKDAPVPLSIRDETTSAEVNGRSSSKSRKRVAPEEGPPRKKVNSGGEDEISDVESTMYNESKDLKWSL